MTDTTTDNIKTPRRARRVPSAETESEWLACLADARRQLDGLTVRARTYRTALLKVYSGLAALNPAGLTPEDRRHIQQALCDARRACSGETVTYRALCSLYPDTADTIPTDEAPVTPGARVA